MGIHIDEINAKNLGPINNIQWKLSTVNLIYGKNESGKTHLVEFLIQSLFRNLHYPGLRKSIATGQITLKGLGESFVNFSPSTKKKLEEYLQQSNETLPTNISRLLIVRAGELSMIDNRQLGIDRSVLEEYLSDSGLINNIRSRIPVTNQKSTILECVIQGNRQGQVKDHYTVKENIKALDELISQVNKDYSTGLLASLKSQLTETNEALEIQKLAKFHLAYSLHNQIVRIEKELEKISPEELQKILLNLSEYETKNESLTKLNGIYKTKIANCSELGWVKAAQEEYQKLLSGETKQGKRHLVFLVFAGLLLAGSIPLMLIRQTYLAIGAILIGSGLGYAYIYFIHKKTVLLVQNHEISRIADEFKQKFNRKLSDIATLRMVFEEQNEANIAALTVENQIKDLQIEISGIEQTISDGLFVFTNKRLSKETWKDQIEEISQHVREQKNKLDENRVEFASLRVDSTDFRIETTDQVYNENQYRMLEQLVDKLSLDISSEDDRLNALRQRLAQETHMDIAESWEVLVEKLQDKRAELVENYKEVTAQVLASIVVNSVLTDVYKEEEIRIREGLRSQEVKSFLKRMTNHYDQIEFESGSLRVADPYSEYNFGDLSTATQEQVLLALRMGISSHCFQGQSMFLVLDDAFQHSDWNRREFLINSIMDVAKSGWQIIYMTMDDNIRDLFMEKAQAAFPMENRMFSL